MSAERLADATPAGRTASPSDLAGAVHRQPVTMTGAQALVRALENVGVEIVFGIPGGAILPAYDPLLDSTQVRHVLVRHEQGAGHAAQGYAAAVLRKAGRKRRKFMPRATLPGATKHPPGW